MDSFSSSSSSNLRPKTPNYKLLSMDLWDFLLEPTTAPMDLKAVEGHRKEGHYRDLAAHLRNKTKQAMRELIDSSVDDSFALAVKKERVRFAAAFVRFLERGQEGDVS